MSRNVFGWDLPPGCTQRHIDEAFGGPDPSPLQQDVLTLLEKARIPQATCDAIMEMIAEAELELAEPDPDQQLEEKRDRQEDSRIANHVDGYDRDDLGESPDY